MPSLLLSLYDTGFENVTINLTFSLSVIIFLKGFGCISATSTQVGQEPDK